MPLFQEEEEKEEEDKRNGKCKSTDKPKRKPTNALQNRSIIWKDINNALLRTYNHEAPSYVECPQQYFPRFFSLCATTIFFTNENQLRGHSAQHGDYAVSLPG